MLLNVITNFHHHSDVFSFWPDFVLSAFDSAGLPVWRVLRSDGSNVVDMTVEICNREFLNISCHGGQVLLVDKALYGRMRVGRCVQRSLGYVDCQADVLEHVQVLCSGRQHCAHRMPDDVIYSTHPCPPDVTSYLEITYRCLTGKACAHIRGLILPHTLWMLNLYHSVSYAGSLLLCINSYRFQNHSKKINKCKYVKADTGSAASTCDTSKTELRMVIHHYLSNMIALHCVRINTEPLQK